MVFFIFIRVVSEFVVSIECVFLGFVDSSRCL